MSKVTHVIVELYTPKDTEWFRPDIDDEYFGEGKPLIMCKDCKYLPGKGRAYADDDPVETYIHCGHLGENGYCSFAKRDDDGTERS